MIFKTTAILAPILLLWAAREPAPLPLAGKVRVTGRGAGTLVSTIVYAESLEDASPTKAGQYRVAQKDKSFAPHVLAIPPGSTVAFPNMDPIFHNVFSLSQPTPFDLGLYRNGDSKTQVFKTPGTYRVFCNIHPQMAAVILVVPTSYIAESDAGGNYRLDLPAGRFRLTAWSERARTTNSIEVRVASGTASTAELVLDESGFINSPHTDKNGAAYPPTAYKGK